MERTELIEVGKRLLARLRSADLKPEEARQHLIRTTSGTTGEGPLVIAIKVTWGFFSLFEGLMRPVVCIGALNGRLTYVLAVYHTNGDAPMRVVALDAGDLSLESALLLGDFKPDTFRGGPSFVAGALQLLPSAVRSEVRNIRLTGETLTEERAQAFTQQAPNATVRMMYATSELGTLSKSESPSSACPYLKRNQYHPADGVEIEIEDMDVSGVGEVYVSKTLGEERIMHYRIGDVARFLPPCRCGEQVTFELVGRTGRDYVKLVGAILRREEFDRVARLFPYIDDYRVEAREVSAGGAPRGHITLRFYHRGGPVTDALLEETKEKFSRELFLTPTQTLAALVKQNIFLPPTIEFSVKPLPQGHKDIKISERRS